MYIEEFKAFGPSMDRKLIILVYMCGCSQSSICSAKINNALSLWDGQIVIIVSTIASLNLILPSSFKQSVRNFSKVVAF
jgi:hypothetical protein